MKLGYTIDYVLDVESSLRFFNQAFGFQQKVLHESGEYGELNTGETTHAFASHALGKLSFPEGHVQANESKQPLGMEIALVTEPVHAAHRATIAHGTTELPAPTQKPWGQVVSHVRAQAGTLVELCSPVHGWQGHCAKVQTITPLSLPPRTASTSPPAPHRASPSVPDSLFQSQPPPPPTLPAWPPTARAARHLATQRVAARSA